MKKFFKALALVLALTLVIGTIPAAAADTAIKAVEKKTLYVGGTKGVDNNGKQSTYKAKVTYAKLLGITKKEAKKLKVTAVSSNDEIVKANDKTRRIRAYGMGTVTVTLTANGKTYDVAVTAKKSADEVVFGRDWANVAELDYAVEAELNKEYTVSVPQSKAGVKIDTDERRLVADDDSVIITPVEGKKRLYTVKFTKAGEFTVTGEAFQSEKSYPGATASKSVKVTIAAKDFDATATGVKEITVTGNGFTKDSKFTIKRDGTISISYTEVVPSEDGTSAKIKLANKIGDGEYTVSDGDKTASFKATDEKVARIEIFEKDGEIYTKGVSTTVSGSAVNGTTLFIHYTTYNQYDEEITKSYPLTWTSSFGNDVQNDKPAKGYITFTNPSNTALYGSTVVVTATYNGSTYVTTEQATCKVGLGNEVNDIEIVGVVDLRTEKAVDGKAVPAFFKNGEYAVYFNLLDRANRLMEYTAADAANLQFSSQSPIIITTGTNPAPTSIVIDGEEYAYVAISRGENAKLGGSIPILVSSSKTGHSDTKYVDVKAENVLDKLVLGAPESVVVEGETVEIPFTATDTEGNEIKDFRTLIKSVTLTAGSGNLRFEEKNDRTAVLKYTAPEGKTQTDNIATEKIDGTVILTSTVFPSGDTKQITLKVKDRAHRSAVAKYHGATQMVEGGSITFAIDAGGRDWDKFLVYADQYDRVNDNYWNCAEGINMNTGSTEAYYVGWKYNGNILTISQDGASTDSVDHDNDPSTPNVTLERYFRNTNITVGSTIADSNNDDVKEETVTFFLSKDRPASATNCSNMTPISGSECKVKFSVYDISQLSAFSLDVDWPSWQTIKSDEDSVTLKVTGKLADGTSLDIPDGYVVFRQADLVGSDISSTTTGCAINVAGQLANHTFGMNGSYKGDVRTFYDLSGAMNADGTHKLRIFEAKAYADVYKKDVVTDPTAATASAIVASNLEKKINVTMGNKYSNKINTQGWIVDLGYGRVEWIDQGALKAIVRPDDGRITYSDLMLAIDTVENNYGHAQNWLDRTGTTKTGMKVEISSYNENADGLHNKKTTNRIAGIANNNSTNIVISNAEIGDTFTAKYTTADGRATLSIDFTVGADYQAVVKSSGTVPTFY